MTKRTPRLLARAGTAGLWVLGVAVVAADFSTAPPGSMLFAVTTAARSELRDWDTRLNRMLRDGELKPRLTRADTLLRGRRHERLAQYHQDVPVFGADVARQLDNHQSVSIFGRLYSDVDLNTTPRLSAEAAQAIVERLAGTPLGPRRRPELTILPRVEGGYTLTYQARVFTSGALMVYFIDAQTGAVSWQFNDLQTQAAIGRGRGVLGDDKKISTFRMGGIFVANDHLRPPALLTFDMRGDLAKTVAFLNGEVDLGGNDLASDTDNQWTDAAAVDAHVYSGWTYDYLYRRFGRRGLDDRNIPIRTLVHPVRRDDIARSSPEVIGSFYVNAFYAGDGITLYGEGLPPGYVLVGGQEVNFLAGALDVVAHELTHGVTGYSSRLIYRNESGALNEAFSDIIGTSVEFFFQPAGIAAPLRADYLVGEDVVVPAGIRSLSNPLAYGDPDHYSRRFTGSEDNGGVHTNSTIVSHVFYLAIEGGTNRTSGLSVQGVGAANREQIEKVFYRAFVFLMPSDATFSVARAGTIQSARDLYGSASAAERAVTQAWAAVGVQ